jgi:hypothetical protein
MGQSQQKKLPGKFALSIQTGMTFDQEPLQAPQAEDACTGYE